MWLYKVHIAIDILDSIPYSQCMDIEHDKKEAHRAATRKYYYSHKEQFRIYAYNRRRDPSRKMAELTMARLRAWLKSPDFWAGQFQGGHNRRKCSAIPLVEIVQCSAVEFRDWLESQLKPGMIWKPRNWQLGHRVPIRCFDCSDEFQLRACFHYKNLQPEFAKDNQRRLNEVVPRK